MLAGVTNHIGKQDNMMRKVWETNEKSASTVKWEFTIVLHVYFMRVAHRKQQLTDSRTVNVMRCYAWCRTVAVGDIVTFVCHVKVKCGWLHMCTASTRSFLPAQIKHFTSFPQTCTKTCLIRCLNVLVVWWKGKAIIQNTDFLWKIVEFDNVVKIFDIKLAVEAKRTPWKVWVAGQQSNVPSSFAAIRFRHATSSCGYPLWRPMIHGKGERKRRRTVGCKNWIGHCVDNSTHVS